MDDLTDAELDLLRQTLRAQIRLIQGQIADGGAHEAVLRAHVAILQAGLGQVEAAAFARLAQTMRPSDTIRLTQIPAPG
jgi:hypothetical protein